MAIGVVLVSAPAWADTFGAYCVGTNYVAYQSSHGCPGNNCRTHLAIIPLDVRPVEYRVSVIPKPSLPLEGPSMLGKPSLSIAAWRAWEKLPGSRTTTERVPLLTDERGHRYVLEVVATFPKKHACASVGLRNRIVEVDSEGQDVHSLVVFRGRDELECGE
jgi:hypothetical protein